MQIVTVNLSRPYLDAIDEMVKRGTYPSRSEAIRVALREFLHHELDCMNILLGPMPESESSRRKSNPDPDYRRIADSKLDRAKARIEAIWAEEVGE